MNLKKSFFVVIFSSLLLNGCGQTNNSDSPQSDSDLTNTENNIVSLESAKEIALTHAGLTFDQVYFLKSNTDWENGNKIYDIEFYTNDQTEYDYEIDSDTGEILEYDHNAEYVTPTSTHTQPHELTAASVKEIVLSQVPGASEQDILEFESEYDDGKLHYEGKIIFEQTKYEFQIDGQNGTISEWDVESITQ